jgi:hypothetical protein
MREVLCLYWKINGEMTSPILTSPVLTSPLLNSPVLASPVLTSPVLTSPVLTYPVLTSLVLTSLVLASLVLACSCWLLWLHGLLISLSYRVYYSYLHRFGSVPALCFARACLSLPITLRYLLLVPASLATVAASILALMMNEFMSSAL